MRSRMTARLFSFWPLTVVAYQPALRAPACASAGFGGAVLRQGGGAAASAVRMMAVDAAPPEAAEAPAPPAAPAPVHLPTLIFGQTMRSFPLLCFHSTKALVLLKRRQRPGLWLGAEDVGSALREELTRVMRVLSALPGDNTPREGATPRHAAEKKHESLFFLQVVAADQNVVERIGARATRCHPAATPC